MNIVLTNNARFNPYTFDEMLKPLAMATQEYNAIEEGLQNLQAEGAEYESSINKEYDKEVYERYKNFQDNLTKQAELLASQGLNPSSRRALLQSRTQYKSDIVPIQKAIERRRKLVDEQRSAMMKDPSLMYDRDFSTIPLSELINNPDLSYTPVSGDDLYKKGKEAALSSSSRILSVDPALQGQYWNIRQGYGADVANQFLLDQSSIPELKQAVDRIVSQSGITDSNKSRATDYIISGIMSGMSYDEKYQPNRGYIDPAERERLDLARDQFNWTKNKWEDETLGAKLPNGDRVKDVGGGRVRITHPDGTVDIMAAPKSTDSTKGQNKDKKPFSGLQFKMWSDSGAVNEFQEGLTNSWSYKRKGFTTGDERLISYTDLSNAMQTNLAAKLAEYGLTFDDVEIWKDSDNLTDNHYQVRLKQSKSNIPQEPEGFGDL